MRIVRLAGFILALAVAPAFGLAAPQPMVRVEVGAGISLAVPKGWLACDAQTSALLGSSARAAQAQSFCAKFDAEGGAKAVIDPRPDSPLQVSVAFLPREGVTEKLLKDATPAWLKTFSDKECIQTFHADAAMATCVFHVETIAGHPALSGLLQGFDAKGNGAALHMVLLVAKGGNAIFLFMTRHPGEDARVAALVGSIAVQ
jgi:hypothetical protein